MNFRPNRNSWFVIVTWLLMVTVTLAAAAKKQSPLDELEQRVLLLLEQEKFKELDDLAADFRQTKARNRNGGWMIHNFYLALEPSDDSGSKVPEAVWKRRESLLQKWRDARTNSITARVAMAAFLIDRAWDARGSGYANTVTEEGWKHFHQDLGEARKVLEQAKNLPEKCHCWYFYMLTVALGEGWNRVKYDKLFEEAVAFEPDQQQFYVKRAQYLMPRWHGEEGEWQASALDAAERTKERWGDAFYARVCNEILDFYDADGIWNSGVDWKRMRQGYEDILKKYPDAGFWLNSLAYQAVNFRDQKTAREAFERIKEPLDPAVWDDEEHSKDSKKFLRESLEWAKPAKIYNPPVDPKELAGLKIVSAKYGTGSKMANVTQRVDELIHTPAIAFFARPNSLGTDPSPGWNKELTIIYEVNGVQLVFKSPENGRVSALRLLNQAKNPPKKKK